MYLVVICLTFLGFNNSRRIQDVLKEGIVVSRRELYGGGGERGLGGVLHQTFIKGRFY